MKTIKLNLRTPSAEAMSAIAPLPQRPPRRRQPRQLYTYGGKTLTLPQWAEETEISVHTIRDRLVMYGWTIERALTEPPIKASPADRRRELNRIRISRITASFRQEAGQ